MASCFLYEIVCVKLFAGKLILRMIRNIVITNNALLSNGFLPGIHVYHSGENIFCQEKCAGKQLGKMQI